MSHERPPSVQGTQAMSGFAAPGTVSLSPIPYITFTNAMRMTICIASGTSDSIGWYFSRLKSAAVSSPIASLSP